MEKENTLEKKIEDEKLINFLGKDRVVIKEITRDELEQIINENNSYIFLENNKELSSKNYIMATKEKDIYKDLYVKKDYKLENLIYIDDNKNLYRIKENIEYDKNLYEIKEQEVMNNNSIKDMFNNLKEKVMIKVNSILGKEKEEIDIEKELREFEELFDSMEIEEYMHFMIDGIRLEASMENGIEEEKLLKLKDDLIELYEREISEEDKTFMKKRGLELDEFIESFEEILKSVDFQEGDYDISFKDYLEEKLRDYGNVEYEEFEEETYMDRLERQQIGEEEYIKIYGKNNVIDSYMPYYERAYTSYKNLDKDKIYTIKDDMKVNRLDIKKGEEFKISGYKNGLFIIEFPNREIKETITFKDLQELSNVLKKDIDNIIELKMSFNENNYEESKSKEMFEEKEVINGVDNKIYYDSNKLKEEFIKDLKAFGVKSDGLEEFFDYTFDVKKINKEIQNEMLKFGTFERVIENMTSTYLYADSYSELDGTITYSDSVLKSKELVKDSIIKLAENKNITFSDLINNEELNHLVKTEDWKLSDRDLDDMSFNLMKYNIEKLMNENYGDFVRAIISIEKGVDDLDLLDKIYDEYMDRDFNLINDNFEDLKNEMGKENLEVEKGSLKEIKFYMSNDDYKLIGIRIDKENINMNELANTNNDKFLEIIKEKSIPTLIKEKNKIDIVNEKIDRLEDKTSKDGTIYYGMLLSFSEQLNKQIDIINKIGLYEELEKNNIERIDEKYIEELKLKARELEVGEVRILESENNSFKENQIIDFPKANDLFKYEEMKIGNIKKAYEKEKEKYHNESVKGEVKISEEKIVEFTYDIGQGKFYNLADLLERQLSNTNNQYEIKEFLIEQGVRENEKEEKGINFISDNFVYDKEKELER